MINDLLKRGKKSVVMELVKGYGTLSTDRLTKSFLLKKKNDFGLSVSYPPTYKTFGCLHY